MSDRCAGRAEELFQALPVGAGFHIDGPRGEIDGWRAGKSFQVERDAALHRDRSTTHTAASAERDDGDLPLGGVPHHLRNLRRGGWPGDDVGRMWRHGRLRPQERAWPAVARRRPEIGGRGGGGAASQQSKKVSLQRPPPRPGAAQRASHVPSPGNAGMSSSVAAGASASGASAASTSRSLRLVKAKISSSGTARGQTS